MKYITLFETTTEYSEATLDLPNVSLIEENMSMHYSPYVPETRVVAKFNVTDTSSSTQLCNSSAVSQFSAIEIDGVIQPSVVSAYTFDTLGKHIVKYTLTDPTSIGDGAFYYCTGLTSIDIPSGVTSIGIWTFCNCSSITRIDIPNSVTNIGMSAFQGCTGLISIEIPSGVTSIGQGAFQSCSSLTSIGIPNSVTSIGNYAFRYCSGLTSCTIGSGVTSIGESTFAGCSSLTSINIPNSVIHIDYYVFQDCSSLTSIISNATTAPTITKYTFYNVNTGGTLTVPSGSSGYDVWMGTGDYYLGLYEWEKVEQ